MVVRGDVAGIGCGDNDMRFGVKAGYGDERTW